MKYLLAILHLLVIWPNDPYPKDYFAMPVKRSIQLSGTFGELRSNHFHAGLDIKSINGQSGEKLFASAGGHVSRIKISPGGYGNALYIDHPNGYTTVYAHLDRFIPEVAAYVKSMQYRQESFSVDLYPNPSKFRFAQGDLIGYMGNTGGSSGPHLHFEIRRTAGQVPLNPLHFGLQVEDTRRPDITHLNVHYLDEQNSAFAVKNYETKPIEVGRYTLADTLIEGAWRVAFSVASTDRMNQSHNRNGVYSVEMLIDSSQAYHMAMDELAFNKTRYLNAHIDYAAQQQARRFYHRCHVLEGNKHTIYNLSNDEGITTLYANQTRDVTIRIADFNGNVSELEFSILRDSADMQTPAKASTYEVSPAGEIVVREPGFTATIPANAVYERHHLAYARNNEDGRDIHTFGVTTIPLHRHMTLSLAFDGTMSNPEKSFVGLVDEDGNITNCGGKRDSSKLTTRIREFGRFTVSQDTIPPIIQAVDFKRDLSESTNMRFTIKDETPTGGSARGLRYYATVDGKWILMEYDAKKNLLTHWFDDRIRAGKHTLRIEVSDDRGNSSVLEEVFVR